MTQIRTSEATASAQTHFELGNFNFDELKFSPFIWSRVGLDEPFSWRPVVVTSSSGGRYHMKYRLNHHEQHYGYAESKELTIYSPDSEYQFHIVKNGSLAHYATSSPGASVTTGHWIFEDFPVVIHLNVGVSSESPSVKTEDTFGYDIDSKDRVIMGSTKRRLYPAPKKKEEQVVFPDTEPFAFLSNVNLYFSGTEVYRKLPSGEVVEWNRHGDGLPTLASRYFLTPDGGYPEGRTELTIKDGFSDATAVVAFDHKDGEVTMTIKLYESRLCDIRDASFEGIVAKHCICIAL